MKFKLLHTCFVPQSQDHRSRTRRPNAAAVSNIRNSCGYTLRLTREICGVLCDIQVPEVGEDVDSIEATKEELEQIEVNICKAIQM